MFLLPFSVKVPKGTTHLIAIGNIMPQEEPLNVYKVELSADKQVLANVRKAKEDDFSGVEITNLVVSSHPTSAASMGNYKAFMRISLNEGTSMLLKTLLVSEPAVIVDERDGIVLERRMYVVISVTSQSGGVVAGTIVLQKPRKFFE